MADERTDKIMQCLREARPVTWNLPGEIEVCVERWIYAPFRFDEKVDDVLRDIDTLTNIAQAIRAIRLGAPPKEAA